MMPNVVPYFDVDDAARNSPCQGLMGYRCGLSDVDHGCITPVVLSEDSY